ncbi:MAG: Diacylglycerol kinase [Candidatus Heimdallarchaeota archaeon LC_2]|nr:MAG: Diacylglycerol kinase [Candidatus Heimdallarchaeota archaeon LC_2]
MVTSDAFYFIVNPASNTGRLKKKWPKLEPQLKELSNKRGFEYEWKYTDAPLHAMKLTEKAEEIGYKNIVAVGGDGVANEIGNYILQNERNLTMGLMPMGTSNDLHTTVDLPKDEEKCFDILVDGNIDIVPVGKVTGDFADNPHYFLNHSDCGLSSLAAQGARDGWKLLKGETKYTFYALKKLARFKRNQAEVTIDGETKNYDLTVIAVSFGEWMAGYKLWPGNSIQQSVDEGNFGLAIAYGQSRPRLLKLMLDAEKGKHIGKKGVEYLRAKKVDIHLERPWPFEAEGEIYTEKSKEISFEYVPHALKLIIPKQIPINIDNNE